MKVTTSCILFVKASHKTSLIEEEGKGLLVDARQNKAMSLEQAVRMASRGWGAALLAGEYQKRSGKCSLGAWVPEVACQVRMDCVTRF